MNTRFTGTLVLASLFFVGCGGLAAYYPEGRVFVEDTDVDSDQDSDTGTDTSGKDPIDIYDVDPMHGTTAGGTEVVIDGGPFDPSAEVYIGGERATVLDARTSALTILTPSGVEGLAELSVTTDTGFAVEPDAFRYWADGQGLFGSYGTLENFEYRGSYWCLDPACNAVGTPDPEGSAFVLFMVPSDLEISQVYGRQRNICASDYEPNLSASVYDPGLSTMTLKRGSSVLMNLSPSTDGIAGSYETTNNVHNDFIHSTSYSLESTGTMDWPALDIDSSANTPGSFEITRPVVSTDLIPTVSRTNFGVTWNGSSADYVVIRITLVDSSGNALERVSCVVDDTGSFTVPSGVWNRWSSGLQGTLLVGRFRQSNAIIEHNRSRSGMVGVQWLLGAINTQ